MHQSIKKTLAAAGIAFAMCGTANAGETFGTSSGQWIFVSANEMQLSSSSCAWNYAGVGYYSVGSAPGATCSSTQARGGFELPEGSRITFYRLYYYNTSGSLNTFLTEYTADNFTGENPNLIDHSSSAATATDGYNAQEFDFTTTLIFDSYDTSVSPSRQRNYVFVVNLPSATTSRIKGVALGFVRQVAPAPASATFNDVPTTHPFFNQVQQLVKSGITAGCGGGNYCPNAAVTRGQMAVFLSKALGLHWDWNTDPAP